MITIKMMSNIASEKEKCELPNSLIVFLEETFKELHEAHDPEVSLNQFSLEMHGPIYMLEKGLDNLVDQDKVKIIFQKKQDHGVPTGMGGEN